MAVGAYLRVIADNFRRAAVDRQQEADLLRRDITVKERALHDQIDALEKEIQQKSLEQLNPNKSSEERADAARQMAQLKQEIQNQSRAFQDQKSEISNVIRQMEQETQEFNQRSNEFTQRSARN
jgi:hypothetical protein